MLYWAYGSNLNHEHMSHRCPAAKPVDSLVVTQGALVFRSVADVTIRKDSIVPGGLWEISRECEASLDRYEGVASRFYLKRYFTVKIGRKTRDVLFYQMRTNKGIMPPADYYLATIVQGYKDFDLDLEILDAAVAQSWADKKVTDMLRERHIRKGMPTLAQARAKL